MSSVIKDPGSSGPSGTTQLVATLFAKSKPAGDTSADITPTDGRQQNVSSIPPRCPSELTTVLNTLVAPYTIQLQSALPLSPRVHQLIYTTTSPGFPPDLRNLPQLTSFERTHSLEIVLQYLPSPSDAPSTTHRTLKLAVFDLDSTLIDQEVIDELARTISITPLVAAITARAMAGELDFSASLRERVALLKGVRADVWDQLKQVVTFAEGARELCRALRRLDVKMAVLSGGFVEMAEWVKGQLGLDYVHANHLLTSPPTSTHPFPHLSGLLSPNHPIIDATQKSLLLQQIATENQIRLHESMSVGDGANDLEMLGVVGSKGGLGVAFKAKERVQTAAPNRLNSTSLTDLLYLLGYNEVEIAELVRE